MLNKQERQVIKLELDKEQKVLDDLERQYKKALKDIEDKIRLLQSDELTQSRIYQLQYQKALRGQVAGILDKLQGDEYATIQEYLHDSYQDGFIGTMYSIHGQGIPLIVPLDQDAAVKAIITDSKLSDKLYNEIGVNIKQLKQAISSEITRGIASNMPFADIARNIANRSKTPLSRAKTIVRTEAHRIQQAAANDARDAAKGRGCDVVKQWDGTLDGDTRPTHRRLDGQIRETDEPFEMDGKTAMYPGDFGKPEEDCNCRCVALTRAKWALDDDELKQLKERAEYFGLDKTKDFKSFEEKYLKAADSPIAKASSFVPAQSISDVNKRIEAVTGSKTDLTGLDLNAANEYLKAFEDMAEEYPELRGYVQQIDTNVPAGLGGGYTQKYSLNKKKEYTVNNSISFSKRTTDKDIAHQIQRGEFFAGQTRYDIATHEITHALESKMANVKNGLYKNRQFIGIDGTKSTSVYAGRQFSESITDRARAALYGDDLTKYFDDIAELGGYAQASDKEMIAQCIAYEKSGKSNRFSAKVKEIFDDEYSSIFGQKPNARITDPLKSQEKSGIINSVEMLQKSSDSRKNFKFISDERFDNLTIAARKKGATIIRGTEEVEAHLKARGASASTIGDVLLFGKDVTVSEVLEETRHFMQNLDGLNVDKGEPLHTILNEIDAKEYVIRNAEKYKVPRNEIEHLEAQIDSYKRELAQRKEGGG